MSGNPHFIIDVDDSLGDFWSVFLRPFNETFGLSLKKEDFTDYNNFLNDCGVAHKEFLNFIVERRQILGLLPVNSTIYNFVCAMYDMRNRGSIPENTVFHAISSRGYCPGAKDITRLWLEEVLPFRVDRISISGNGRKKSSFIPNGDTVFCVVDDHIDNILDIVENCDLHPEHQMTLVDQPWNRHVDPSDFDFGMWRIVPHSTPIGESGILSNNRELEIDYITTQ